MSEPNIASSSLKKKFEGLDRRGGDVDTAATKGECLSFSGCWKGSMTAEKTL